MIRTIQVARLVLALSPAVVLLSSCNNDDDVEPPMPEGFYADTTPGHTGPTCGPPIGPDRSAAIPGESESWANWFIPEFQDKQAFVNGSDGVYGPVACIVARDDIDLIKRDEWDAASGVLIAVIFVDPGPLTPPYSQLHLQSGFNCVLLKRSASASIASPPATPMPVLGQALGKANASWVAHIVRSHDRVCDPPSAASQLTAVAVTAEGANSAAYPQVARFMILSDWKPAIGVKCGEAWCIIGASSAAPAPTHTARIPTGGVERMMHVVPGWYDEQQLAVPQPDGSLRAQLRASIVPVEGLDRFTIADFDTGFVKVATVYFQDQPVDKYATVFQFSLAATKPDTLYLRHWPKNKYWEARVDHRTTRLRVLRTPHPEKHITGTARWAWQDKDEWIWVRCEDGCCLVEPYTASSGISALANTPYRLAGPHDWRTK